MERGRPPHPDILTPRQWEVLELVREGLSNGEIGERLGISTDGAKFHVAWLGSDGFHVLDLWASLANFQRLPAQRRMPAVARAGLDGQQEV